MSAFTRFRKADDGLGAVEFALVAPVMLLVLLGCVELPQAIMTGQRLARAARTMADLISYEGIVSLNDVYAAGAAVTTPYTTTGMGIVLTAAGVYDENGSLVSRVCSSAAQNATAHEAQKPLGPAPPSSAEARARYVIAEITYTYKPLLNVIPYLDGFTFSYQTNWPVRKGTAVNGQPEVILPGGAACT